MRDPSDKIPYSRMPLNSNSVSSTDCGGGHDVASASCRSMSSIRLSASSTLTLIFCSSMSRAAGTMPYQSQFVPFGGPDPLPSG